MRATRLFYRHRAALWRAVGTSAAIARTPSIVSSAPSSMASRGFPPQGPLRQPTRAFSFKLPFFGSGGGADHKAGQAPTAARVRKQHEDMVGKAHQTASLHNEQLLAACLDILELCGGSATGEKPRLNLDHASKETLWELADVLLHDFRRPPWEQFDLVYLSLCLPIALEDRQVHRALMVILESIVPEPVYRVFESNNLILSHDDVESEERRHVLRVFMHALLGNMHVQEGLEPEEVLLVYTDDFKALFPNVAASPAFHALEGDVEGIAMRAKLFALLGQLCAEFDRERTGKVLVSELRETADRVLGTEQARMLLEGAPVDEDGRIAYPQLAALLTRPPPKHKPSASAAVSKGAVQDSHTGASS